MTKTFVAQYYSRCAICDDDIVPGDECAYYENELCHEDCALLAQSEDARQW